MGDPTRHPALDACPVTPRADVSARGRARLDAIDNPDAAVRDWKTRLHGYAFTEAPDDPYIWLSNVLALDAVSRGNYGVGAVIVREADGDVVAEGQNHLLRPYMRTDHHAEMVAMDRFEDAFRQEDRRGFTLYSSLECCPMCTVRLINGGIRTVYFAADDDDCGMARFVDRLPAFWRRTAALREPPQRFERPRCAPLLMDWAGEIFRSTEQRLNEIVRQR